MRAKGEEKRMKAERDFSSGEEAGRGKARRKNPGEKG